MSTPPRVKSWLNPVLASRLDRGFFYDCDRLPAQPQENAVLDVRPILIDDTDEEENTASEKASSQHPDSHGLTQQSVHDHLLSAPFDGSIISDGVGLVKPLLR